LGPQVEAFLQKYPFASAHTIAKHFLTTAFTVKEILQRELGMRKVSWRWIPHSLSDAQKVARIKAAKEMLRILEESETIDFNGIATGNESWFQHTTASSKMFAGSAADVIPRTPQAVGAKQTMITVFFNARKRIMFDVLPRGSIFNQLYFSNSIFPDLKTVNLNFRRQNTGSTFWVHMDLSMCNNGSKVKSKIKKNHINRMPHPPYSPDMSQCDFLLFETLKQILRNRKFSSSDELEDVIAQV
jgi:histone-lysine N-methyltransferase SETMAR